MGENALAVKGAWNRGYSLALVIFIIQVGPNWKAPWKRGICTYSVAIFQVAWNPLKFGMPILFCVKKFPFFFQEGRKIWTKLHKNPPPPLCPSPNIVGFQSWELKHWRACVCFTPLEGGAFKSVFEALFPRLWKKKGHFFTKSVGMPNFSRFRATWKIEIGTYAPLPRSPSIINR